ncbi:serine/threonine-protein kinase [Mangrovihabitans endophyticus]|uniref:non-specific serine/threonine protein kinase n=1 Tax=Mangrovihabitans endophyticus TaxID=1751298 RepID=A0A8J3BYS7_9ACTN|nr:serine/threonine-protein kinase [Mangrovihabitans endophyticus]GGK90695.1 serine/threonine protein kinase [Mangrovihabitans endophyticus]
MAVRHMLIAGRYRLGEPVGTGGMGRVWMARDEMLDRDVAVKEFVPPDWMTDDEKTRLRDRTLREARSAARLNHPNVVQIYDVVHADGLPWIVMELVPSRSLHQVIVDDGPYSPLAAARIGLKVLDALSAAHRAGVLHRDIKPHNVLIGQNGRVVLTDFGLATFVDDGTVTGPGLVVGSPQYVSPERARDGASTVESDLWSFGATLYASVEGRSPYARESAMATLMALATEQPDPPVLAEGLAPVLTGLLRRAPGDRLSADEVGRRLRAFIAAGGRTPAADRSMVPAQRQAGGAASATAGADGSRADGSPAHGKGGAAPPWFEPRPRRMSGDPGRPLGGDDGEPPAAAEPAVDDRPDRDGGLKVEVAHGRTVPSSRRVARRGRSVMAAVLTVAVIGVAVYATRRGAGDTDTGASSAAGPASRATIVAPGGFNPVTCNRPPSADASRTPQQGAARRVGNWALPPGYSLFTDDRSDLRLGVPDGWTYERVGTTICFRDPDSLRVLSVDPARKPTGDPLTACRAERDRMIRLRALPGYREISLGADPFAEHAAQWEYRYTSGGVLMHVITRWVALPGRAYALGWLTREIDWVGNKPTYQAIQPSVSFA